MDHDQCDAFARALATGVSRRQALQLLGSSLAGGLLAAFGSGTAAAKPCKKQGQRCKGKKECCSDFCFNGTCGCPPGTAISVCGDDFLTCCPTGTTCQNVCNTEGCHFACI